MRFALKILLASAVFAACTPSPEPEHGGGVQVGMDFDRSGSFYDAPFPSDDLQNPDGTVRIDGFPNPDEIPFIESTLDAIRNGVRGFGLASGVFFQLTGEPDYDRLPDVHESVEAGASILLIGVTPDAPDYLRRYPVDVSFTSDAGPFGSENMLSVLPLQGIALRPDTRYAAVILRSLRDRNGALLGVSPGMRDLARGRRPSGLEAEAFNRYLSALDALKEAGISTSSIAGLAVFTTGDPAAELGVFREAMLDLPRPAPNAAFVKNETFDDFCVYESTIDMPVYQTGTPPFSEEGGTWTTDAAGKPVLQGYEEANLVVTVPRSAMPAQGYPTAVFIRTGGGGERPLVDRGVRDADGNVITAGTGPAMELARVGYAGVSVDGPHGGRRNVTGGDEQILMFNFLNPGAMRDNVRQSALETILLAHVLEGVSIDASDCAGAATGAVKLDTGKLALIGHSMGATIAQPVLAFEPLYRALILSGAGASWLENLVFKKKPLDVPGFAEVLLNYITDRRKLHRHDPTVSLVQWAGDASDGPAYNQLVTDRHVLMFQGIVDHYILPPIANATSLSMRLDLAGGALDSETDELAPFRPIDELLTFSGGKSVEYPVRANREGATAVVVQHKEDGVEDGHEVMFQLEGPKHQYRCFLKTFAESGAPSVIAPDGVCP